MKKICFIGAPSTGKSTLAGVLAEKLKLDGYKTELVREFARDFIVEHGEIKKAEDQIFIAQGQKQREKEAIQKNPQFIICDCAVFLALVYASLFKPETESNKEILNYKNVLKKIDKEIRGEIMGYHHVFFLPPELPAEEDGVRLYTDKIFEISDKIKEFLVYQKIDHLEISGDIESRALKVFEALKI